ncbi:hypothetical protein QJS10_CPA02g00107 [Acorus calamus]|uniref:Uncharacterized protein n=1 Tax=Acorus calamus TaxID=4465 RepID=A0AAV9FB01_ACOCL|nr:hypothetical protein QJS10_CPA02g00107 [Acorus calamus]
MGVQAEILFLNTWEIWVGGIGYFDSRAKEDHTKQHLRQPLSLGDVVESIPGEI